jgi:hypothetical protein
MQKIFFVIILSSLFSVSAAAQQDIKASIAGKIAQRMKDTLDLDLAQKEQLYDINISLANQKAALRSSFAVGSDSLRIKTQRVENGRDSLYRVVLTESQYLLYQQKKRNLVTNN